MVLTKHKSTIEARKLLIFTTLISKDNAPSTCEGLVATRKLYSSTSGLLYCVV